MPQHKAVTALVPDMLRLYREEGYNYTQIADQLGLSSKAVRARLKPLLTEAELQDARRRQSKTKPNSTWTEALRLFNDEGLSINEIAERVGTSASLVSKYISPIVGADVVRQRGFEKSKAKLKGSYNPRWVGRRVDTYGYVWVEAPDWYTGSTHNSRVKEHILVYCDVCGLTELPSGFEVHHIDENKENNNFNNLQLVTVTGHRRIHHLGI